MKVLLVLVAVLVLVWMLTGSRRRRVDRAAPSVAKPPVGPVTMLVCAQCGLHLPREEALPGRGGAFCGEPHRAAFERAHPLP